MIAWKWSMLLEEKVPIVENLVYDKKKKKKKLSIQALLTLTSCDFYELLWLALIEVTDLNVPKVRSLR